MKKFAKHFCSFIYYVDNCDDFFKVDCQKDTYARKCLARLVLDIRNTQDKDIAASLARAYFYKEYSHLWNTFGKEKYMRPTYTIEFEKMLNDYL